jgi:hypothetical protein
MCHLSPLALPRLLLLLLLPLLLPHRSLEVALNSIAFLRFCASRLAEGSIGDLPEGVPALEPEKTGATRLVCAARFVSFSTTTTLHADSSHACAVVHVVCLA